MSLAELFYRFTNMSLLSLVTSILVKLCNRNTHLPQVNYLSQGILSKDKFTPRTEKLVHIHPEKAFGIHIRRIPSRTISLPSFQRNLSKRLNALYLITHVDAKTSENLPRTGKSSYILNLAITFEGDHSLSNRVQILCSILQSLLVNTPSIAMFYSHKLGHFQISVSNDLALACSLVIPGDLWLSSEAFGPCSKIFRRLQIIFEIFGSLLKVFERY